MMASYPLVGEVSFELRALIGRTQHPGIGEHAALLVAAIMEPAATPAVPDATPPSPQGARLHKSGSLRESTKQMDDEGEDAETIFPDDGGRFLAFLRTDKNPLWNVSPP